MAASDVYRHVDQGARDKKEIEFIKQKATDMMGGLKNKLVERLEKNKEQNVMRMSVIHQLRGDTKAYLVQKFANNIKMKAKETKDKIVRENNEKMIKDILKKKVHNEAFKIVGEIKKKERR